MARLSSCAWSMGADLLGSLRWPPLLGAGWTRGSDEEISQHVQPLHILAHPIMTAHRSHTRVAATTVRGGLGCRSCSQSSHATAMEWLPVRVEGAGHGIWCTLGMVSCSTTCARQATMEDSREDSTDGALRRNQSTAELGGPANDRAGHQREGAGEAGEHSDSPTADTRPSSTRTAQAQRGGDRRALSVGGAGTELCWSRAVAAAHCGAADVD